MLRMSGIGVLMFGFSIALFALGVYALVLLIIALRIYIKKNSN